MKSCIVALVVVLVVLAIYWVSGVDIGRGCKQGEALMVSLAMGLFTGIMVYSLDIVAGPN